MKTQHVYKNRNAREIAICVFTVFTLYSTGCGTSPIEQAQSQVIPSATPEPLIPLSTISLLTETPVPTSIAHLPTAAYTAIPTSTWKEGWIDFINGYYGYAISLPPSAEVTKLHITSYSPDELPGDWNEKEDYFDYLEKTYPPGLCVSMEVRSGLIQIGVADGLGGRYNTECTSFGGLGVAHWVWSEEEVFIGDAPYLATVLGQCDSDAPDAKCSTQAYGIPMKDGGGIVVFGDDPILFEILRSYREVPRTEVYCPDPAPTRLKVGESAYISTEPPLSYNNVREAPGINQTLTGKIEPGRAVELLEGPVCNNSLQWWKVRVSNTTFEGWTPEGDHKRYWLVPCESKENCGKS